MILWLTEYKGGRGLGGAIQAILKSALSRGGITPGSVMFNSLHFKCSFLREHDEKKMLEKSSIALARAELDKDIKILKPKVIVINDEDTLRVITETKYTLATTRGSLYFYRGIPCIVIDDFATIRFKAYGQFQFELDLAKIARWATGRQKNEPSFDQCVCKTVGEVIAEVEAAKSASMVAIDTETTSGFISVISFTYDTQEGKLRTFTVPFFDPFRENGAYWATEKEEIAVRKLINVLMDAPIEKVYQNGTYDCAYQIKECMEPTNYLIDTQNLMHCLWVEAPKRLHNIASYFVDHYTYWKDENKGEKEDGWGKSRDSVNRYWRYNGLDTYYTYLGAVELIARIVKVPWAMKNYSMEFSLSVGPCLAASLRGIKTDPGRHMKIMSQKQAEFDRGKEDLRSLSCEADFNINSPADVAWLLYDVLGAKKTRLQRKGSKYGLRSTDEKVLKLMKEQRNFFISNTIDRLLKAKKPGGQLSKYGNFRRLTYRNNRFLSWHNAAATETFRFNSTGSQFWTGTNAQNMQPEIQEMFTADEGFVYVDCDFSASDDWFIAHEAEDEAKIALLKSGKDVHCTHAAVFFKRPYQEIYLGYKEKAEWVVHPITGVRQVSKKIAHGKNFRMQAEMQYNLMGRDAVVATAKQLGYKNAEGLSDKELIGICDQLGDLYDHPRTGMYKRIRPWQNETVETLKANNNLATNAHGITRFFFGSADDPAVQRQLSAYYGQSGTSGNANRALREIFYSGLDDGKTVIFLVQVHDSFKFLCHRSALSKIAKIKEIMEAEICIKGRTFRVPVNVEVGLTDGKKMLPWRADITYEEICAHEEKTYGAKFPKGILANLENLDLGEADVDIDFDKFENELDQAFGDPMSMDNHSSNAELAAE